MNARDPLTLASVPDAFAVVVRRNDLVPTRGIDYVHSGSMSAVALAEMLEPVTGPLVRVRFRPALTGSPNTVAWEAATENAEIVTGTLALHAEVADDEVRTWVAVRMDQRVDPLARRVAIEYMRRRHGLERVDGEEVGDEQDERVGAGLADPG